MFNKKEYQQDYYQKNKEKQRETFKKWREENKEKKKETDFIYKLKNKEKIATKQKLYIQNTKKETMVMYGGKCNCCGETLLDFLTIDHKNNNGNIERKTLNQGTGNKFYNWLKKHNYPKEYQILCRNCNYSKHLNNGKCIHQIMREEEQNKNKCD